MTPITSTEKLQRAFRLASERKANHYFPTKNIALYLPEAENICASMSKAAICWTSTHLATAVCECDLHVIKWEESPRLRAKQKVVPVFPLRILCKQNFSSQTTHNLIKPSNIKFTNHMSKNRNLRSSRLFLQHLGVQEVFPQVKNHLSRTPFSRLNSD